MCVAGAPTAGMSNELGRVFRIAGATAPAPGPGGTYHIPVRCQEGGLRLDADPGPPKLGSAWGVVGSRMGGGEVCVWGHKYPVVPLLLQYKGKTQGVKVPVGQRLLHPLILGTNQLAGVT